MKHKIKVAVVALLMSMAVIFTPVAAHADSFGNKVYNSCGSNGNVRVYGDVRYQRTNGQYYVARGYIWLAPCQNSWSTGRMIDAKSYVAPNGCDTFHKTSTWNFKRMGYTHLVSQSWGVHTTLVLYC